MEVIEKDIDFTAEKNTVVDAPSIEERRSPYANSLVLQIAQAAQSITTWGIRPALRDQELRTFWIGESWLSSVVYSVSIRNASFAWKILGSNPEKAQPRNTIMAVNRILNNSNRGKGWKNLIIKTCIDLYTQDNGAFWEIIRLENRPDSPVINIAHLDAAQCQRTGDPRFPVIYTDRYGKEIPLPYWSIRTIEEFPSPIEESFDLQYCAVTRALLAAEIIQSIAVYKLEKVSGNFTRSLDIVSGATKKNIDDATALAEEQNLNKGLYRYSLPVIIPGVDPTATLSHIHIDLASLPDNFDEDTSFKWYVAQLAAAFGVDYQEIAPLMTGNLGSSQQSEIMHLKTRGKGPALIMGIFEDVINNTGLVPSNVEFKFLEQDIRSETEKANATFTRVKARAMQIKSGELTPEAARELAVDAGDIPRWLAKEVDKSLEFNAEKRDDEFGPTQIESGTESQMDKMTMEDVQRIRNAVSSSPIDFLQKWTKEKGSVGYPSGTVIAGVHPMFNEDFSLLKSELLAQFNHTRARFLPVWNYHITMVHSPLVDLMEYESIAQLLDTLQKKFPLTITSSRISSFDTNNGKAIVLLVDNNPILKDVQQELFNKFKSMSIPISEFSDPKEWKPHITLAYVDTPTFKERKIEPIQFVVEHVTPTRSDYSFGVK